MNRARLASVIAISMLTHYAALAAEPVVTVSTVPASFKARETVKVQVEIVADSSYENAQLELNVMDTSKVFLHTFHNIGAISREERRIYTFPDIFIAPATPEGNRLTVTVLLLHAEKVDVDSVRAGVRRLIYKCTTGVGGKTNSPVLCVYKTPAQLAIDALNERPQPKPHP